MGMALAHSMERRETGWAPIGETELMDRAEETGKAKKWAMRAVRGDGTRCPAKPRAKGGEGLPSLAGVGEVSQRRVPVGPLARERG